MRRPLGGRPGPGIADPADRVACLGPKTAADCAEFRGKPARFPVGPFPDARQAEAVRSGVAPFDRAFGVPA